MVAVVTSHGKAAVSCAKWSICKSIIKVQDACCMHTSQNERSGFFKRKNYGPGANWGQSVMDPRLPCGARTSYALGAGMPCKWIRRSWNTPQAEFFKKKGIILPGGDLMAESIRTMRDISGYQLVVICYGFHAKRESRSVGEIRFACCI